MFQVQMTDNSTKRKRYGKLKTNGYAPHVLVDFPRAAASLQPVPIARSGAPLRLVGSLRVALLKFWIPKDLPVASRAILFFRRFKADG